jgi:hypothetical protein
VEGGKGPLQRGGRPSSRGRGGLLPPEPGGGGLRQRLPRKQWRGGLRAGLEAVREVVAALGGLLRPGKDAAQLLFGLPEDIDAAIDLLPESLPPLNLLLEEAEQIGPGPRIRGHALSPLAAGAAAPLPWLKAP